MNSFSRVMSRKVLNSLITILLVLILNFFLFRVMPGDPIKLVIPNDPKISQEYIEKLINDFGLDQPLYVQFFNYMWNAVTLDFGYSFAEPDTLAMDIVLEKLKWTLILTGTSSIFMILIGMTIGVIAAWRRGSAFDTGSLAFSLFFYAMPTFWFAMMLIVVFSIEIPLFPPDSALTYGSTLQWNLECLWDLLNHLFLPALSLTVGSIAAFSLIMRGSLIDVMTEEYITTARAKGLTEGRVLKDHAIPNAMLPMVALIAIDLAFVVGGAFQTEVVFNYPGIGWETVDATLSKNYPILQAAFFLIALAVIFANLIADILMVYLDPRVKMEG
jgi:peptide/nickel transport system permease protein